MFIQKLRDRLSFSDRKIDRFLDGTMPEDERDLFEQKCLEDGEFLLRVEKRDALRLRVAQTFAENSAEWMVKKSLLTARGSVLERRIPVSPGRRIGWAFALLAVALFCLYLFLIVPARQESMAVNTELEGILGARVLRGESVQVLSPTLPAYPDGELLFSWQTTAKGPFKVIILDSQAAEIDSLFTEGVSIRYAKTLAPGIYYWKLLQNDDWIYTGKIIIEKR